MTFFEHILLNILENKRANNFENSAKCAYKPIFSYSIKNSISSKLSLTTLLHSADDMCNVLYDVITYDISLVQFNASTQLCILCDIILAVTRVYPPVYPPRRVEQQLTRICLTSTTLDLRLLTFKRSMVNVSNIAFNWSTTIVDQYFLRMGEWEGEGCRVPPKVDLFNPKSGFLAPHPLNPSKKKNKQTNKQKTLILWLKVDLLADVEEGRRIPAPLLRT